MTTDNTDGTDKKVLSVVSVTSVVQLMTILAMNNTLSGFGVHPARGWGYHVGMVKPTDIIEAGGRRYRRSGNVVCRRIAGETLLVPVHGALADMRRLYILEGSGADVWEMLDGKPSLAQVAEELTSRYHVSVQEAFADVERLMGDLLERDLVQELRD